MLFAKKNSAAKLDGGLLELSARSSGSTCIEQMKLECQSKEGF